MYIYLIIWYIIIIVCVGTEPLYERAPVGAPVVSSNICLLELRIRFGSIQINNVALYTEQII